MKPASIEEGSKTQRVRILVKVLDDIWTEFFFEICHIFMASFLLLFALYRFHHYPQVSEVCHSEVSFPFFLGFV